MLKQIKKANFWKMGETLLAIVLALFPLVSFAELNPGAAGALGGSGVSVGGPSNITGVILDVITWALGIAFLVAVVMLIVGGFFYMTAGGNEKRTEKGRKFIIDSLIGLVVIILSYLIVSVVNNTIGNIGNGVNGG